MNTYFLCLTQYYNVGDLLINKMLIDEYSRYGKVYVDCPDAPEDFRCYLFDSINVVDVKKEYNFTVKSKNFLRFIFLLKSKEITCYSQSPGPLGVNRNLAKRIFFKIVHFCAHLANASFYLIGNCCSTIESKNEKIKLSDADAVYVRSHSGVSYLQRIRENNANYIPDLAYLLRFKVFPTKKNKIAVITFRKISINKDQFINWIKVVFQRLLDQGYSIEMFYQVKKDKDFMIDLYEQVKTDGVTFRDTIVWMDSFDYYSNKELVISNRLHSLLVGVVYGCLPLAYVDGFCLTNKIKDVFNSSLSNSDNFITDSSTIEKLEYLLSNKNNMLDIMNKDTIENAQICRDSINTLLKNEHKI